MTPNGSHRATPSSVSQSLPGGNGGPNLETARAAADSRRTPIRVGIQTAIWRAADTRAIGNRSLEMLPDADLVLLAARAMTELERRELKAAA